MEMAGRQCPGTDWGKYVNLVKILVLLFGLPYILNSVHNYNVLCITSISEVVRVFSRSCLNSPM